MQVVCPHCGGVVDTAAERVRKVRPDRVDIARRALDTRDRVQDILKNAQRLGFEVDYGAYYAPKRMDYRFLHDLWFEWNYEQQLKGGKFIKFRSFDPWGAHSEAQSLIGRVVGTDGEYEMQAGRMFGWRRE